MRIRVLAAGVVVATLLTACGGSGSKSSSTRATATDEGATTTSVSASEETASSLPPGAVKGFDDYNGDGEPEPLCATHDYGAGLVLRLWCDQAAMAGYASSPPDGVTLVADSLFRLPGPPGGGELPGFEGMSGSTIQSRDPDGHKVILVTFNSDSLFETGSAQLSRPEGLDAVIHGLNQNFPGGAVQVRGHTDSTGTPAVNQPLSEQRASNVADYLKSHGLNGTGFTSVGLASTVPLAEERKPDGSASAEGQTFNRRVEIVVRLAR
jgi:outer membrane protein OmpA-like peptidoglycan-associated protein